MNDKEMVRLQWHHELGVTPIEEMRITNMDGSITTARVYPKRSRAQRIAEKARERVAERLREIADRLDPDGASW